MLYSMARESIYQKIFIEKYFPMKPFYQVVRDRTVVSNNTKLDILGLN